MKAAVLVLMLFAVGGASLQAIEVTQVAGAAHAYPAMLDLTGRKLGTGEFTQEATGHLLEVHISYELADGSQIDEKAGLQQGAQLTQKSWSWREQKNDSLEREYAVDFESGKATARKKVKGKLESWSKELRLEPGRSFAGFGFTLALQNLRDKLVKGQSIELQAVGFTPKPRTVTVKLIYQGSDQVRMSGRELRGEHFIIQPQIPAIAKLFIKISDTHMWLTPPPSGFLRWEGPLAEPNDGLVRVDLASGGKSGAARKAPD